MASCEEVTSTDGLRMICLENASLRVSILPDAGGKIAELVDRRSGRSWLWQNPHLPMRRPVYGADYGRELDSGGWDEILFSTSPCEVELASGTRHRIPDHGDLVGLACEVEHAATLHSGDAICDLATMGRAFDFRWRRTAILDAERPLLTLKYSLHNTGTAAWPWAWCAHPLIAVEPGMQIDLPHGQKFRVADAHRLNVEELGADHRWPNLRLCDGRVIDLASSFDAVANDDRFAAKLFVQSASPGEVSVVADSGVERLTFRYDERRIPWIGLWINNRTWSGCGSEPHFNLGVEPSTSPCEILTQAISEGWTELLEPGKIRTWSLVVEVES